MKYAYTYLLKTPFDNIRILRVGGKSLPTEIDTPFTYAQGGGLLYHLNAGGQLRTRIDQQPGQHMGP